LLGWQTPPASVKPSAQVVQEAALVQALQCALQAAQTVLLLAPQAVITNCPAGQLEQVAHEVLAVAVQAAVWY